MLSSPQMEWIIPTLRSLFYKKLNRDLIGYTVFDQIENVAPSEIAAFCAATSDSPANSTAIMQIPPFFVAKMAYPAIKKIITGPALGMKLLDMVHATTEVKIFLPLPCHGQLTLATSIQDIEETRGGDLLKIFTQVKSGSALHLSAVIGLLVRIKGRQGSPRTSAQESAQGALKQVYGADLQTRVGQPLAYAAASGDHNFIHTSRFVARAAGFSGPIMHGNCLMAMAFGRLQDWLGQSSSITQMAGRFHTPVIPGEKLSLAVYATPKTSQFRYEIKNSVGRIVIKDGLVAIRHHDSRFSSDPRMGP